MATVHSQERPYKCDFCNHSSGRKDKIREHIQSVHLKTRPPRPKKKYPKKPKSLMNPANSTSNSSTAANSSSSSSTDIVHLPQHPLPRHELQTGTIFSLRTCPAGSRSHFLQFFLSSMFPLPPPFLVFIPKTILFGFRDIAVQLQLHCSYNLSGGLD